MSRLTVIVAATKTNGIGSNSRLPWRLPADMKYFAQVTSNAPEGKHNYVVMGRNTWESIPKRFRPLPKRMNVVITRNTDYDLYVIRVRLVGFILLILLEGEQIVLPLSSTTIWNQRWSLYRYRPMCTEDSLSEEPKSIRKQLDFLFQPRNLALTEY